MRSSIFPIVLVFALLAGCKHTPAPEPAEPEPVEQPPTAELDPPGFMEELPLEAQRGLFIAAGCADDDALTASTCRFCPGENSPLSEISVVRGAFLTASSQDAVVVLQGCGEEFGARTSTLVLLAQQAPDTWKEHARMETSGVQQCQEAPGEGGLARMICTSDTVRYGTTSRYIELIDWHEADAATPPERVTLVEMAERQSCELNIGISHLVGGPSYQDTDGDGDEEILITITTTTGPFTGELSACPEDNFSGELSPARQTSATTTRYVYELTPEGPTERSGLPVYLSVGEEFETLMEQ